MALDPLPQVTFKSLLFLGFRICSRDNTRLSEFSPAPFDGLQSITKHLKNRLDRSITWDYFYGDCKEGSF